MSATARILLASDVVECAGLVSGTATWSGNHKHDQVAVTLQYRTHGRGDTDSGMVAHADLGTAEAGEERFQLAVHAAAPVTYHGRLLQIVWQVVIKIPPSRGLSRRTNEMTTADLTVVPHGWLAVRSSGLGQVPQPAPWGTPERPGDLR
jgi:hypothetical protein